LGEFVSDAGKSGLEEEKETSKKGIVLETQRGQKAVVTTHENKDIKKGGDFSI